MSTIIADNLTGKTSAGDITVTSEGGAATQSLQQGLAKVWFYLNQTGTQSLIDSLNCSSITDIAGGQSQVSFSSSFSNINWAAGAVGGGSADDVVLQKYSTSYWGTGSTDWFNHDVYTGFVDSAYGTSIITGDLA
jgi:hypothetical protein